jgi:hypothetical protein
MNWTEASHSAHLLVISFQVILQEEIVAILQQEGDDSLLEKQEVDPELIEVVVKA